METERKIHFQEVFFFFFLFSSVSNPPLSLHQDMYKPLYNILNSLSLKETHNWDPLLSLLNELLNFLSEKTTIPHQNCQNFAEKSTVVLIPRRFLAKRGGEGGGGDGGGKKKKGGGKYWASGTGYGTGSNQVFIIYFLIFYHLILFLFFGFHFFFISHSFFLRLPLLGPKKNI